MSLRPDGGDLGGHAAEYILYSQDKEELFQAFRNEMTKSLIHHYLNLFCFSDGCFKY